MAIIQIASSSFRRSLETLLRDGLSPRRARVAKPARALAAQMAGLMGMGLSLAGPLFFGRPAYALETPRPAAISASKPQRAATGPAATAVALDQTATSARLAFDMNETVDISVYALSYPDRIVVELPETAFLMNPAIGKNLARKKNGAGLISDFRFGHFMAGRARIVADLTGPAKIVRATSEPTPAGGAAKLVIELAAADAESFQAAARAAQAERSKIAATPAPVLRPSPAAAPPGRPVVALDPGHGGVDVGAGAKDAIEKAIVLEFAIAVAAKLEANGKVKPTLTRREDVFVPLAERVTIAQNAGAGLFVSIHADTLRETNVKGATVYTLSDKASDAESARIAANENAADRAGGVADAEDVSDVHDILTDLTRRETRVLSHAYARSLVAYWKSAGELNKNPIRSAGFRVLKAIDTPSVLLELGYLSSESDLARLTSAEWRDRATANVAESIERYFSDQNAQDATASPAQSNPRDILAGADAGVKN